METTTEAKHRPNTKLLAAAAAAIWALSGAPRVLAEVTGPVDIDIDTQPLQEALDVVSETYDLPVISPGKVLNGKQAPGVSGRLTSDEAVTRLLRNSGLEARRSSTGAILISVTAQQSANPSDNGESAGVRRESAATKPVEDEIVVEGRRSKGFAAGENGTATPLTANPLEIPFAAIAVPREVLDEVGALDLQDAYDFVSSVNPQGGYGGINSGEFFGRGFSGGEPLRNGYRDFGFLTTFDLSYIDRIEVVKGPASILYGAQSSPGLQVNYVTKSPTAERFVQSEITVGSFENTRVSLDSGGSLSDDDELTFRFSAAYEDAESHRDFVGNDGFAITPVLQWSISPQTTAKIEATYQQYDFTFDRGLPPIPESLEVPIDRFLGEPQINDADGESFAVFGDFDHRFNEAVSYHFGFSYLRSDVETQIVAPRDTLNEDGFLDRRYEESDEYTTNLAIRNEIFLSTSVGSVENSFFVGVEYADFLFSFDFDGASIAPINFFDPVYGAQIGELSPAFGSEYGAESIAAYWQNLVTLAQDRPFLHKLSLMIGGRFDHVEFDRRNLERFGGAIRVDTDASNYTSQAGLVYQPDPTTALYIGFSQSFNQFSLLRTVGPDSVPADFERGRSFEAGVKKEWLEGGVTSTLNFFNTEKTNVITADPEDPTLRIQVGEQRSRGIELDVIGEIRPGWNILANYAFTDAEVTNDNTIPVGDVLPNVPEHAAGIWTSYQFQDGPFSGLRLGTGLIYEGERETRLPNTIQIPEYTRWDALISYEVRDDWKAQINFNNITDETIYDSQSFFIVPQAGFNLAASLTAHF